MSAGLETVRLNRSLRFRPIAFTSSSSWGRAAIGRGRAKRLSVSAPAWSIVHRLYPDLFDRDVPNPWRGVTKDRRAKAIKPRRVRKSMCLPTWQLTRVTLRWELRPLSVSNGCSGRKMYSPGSSVEPITEGARSRRPFESSRN
jgi:hypothetical protein